MLGVAQVFLILADFLLGGGVVGVGWGDGLQVGDGLLPVVGDGAPLLWGLGGLGEVSGLGSLVDGFAEEVSRGRDSGGWLGLRHGADAIAEVSVFLVKPRLP